MFRGAVLRREEVAPATGPSLSGVAFEKIFGALEEGFALGVGVFVVEGGKVFEGFALFGGEFGGHFDEDADVEVAGGAAAQGGDAAAFEPEDFAVLCAGGDFDCGGAVQCGDVGFSAQGGGGEGDGDFAEDVLPLALEDGVLGDVEDNVEVAGGAALVAGFAFAGDAQAVAVVNAGGDVDGEGFGAFDAAGAATFGAGFFDDFACAVAGGAGLHHLDETADGGAHLAAAAAGGAGDFFGAGLGTRAVAGVAGLEFADGDVFFAAADGFFEGELEVVAQVGAFAWCAARGAAGAHTGAEDFVEDGAAGGAAEAAAVEDFAEDFEGINRGGATGEGSASAAAGGEGGVAEAVVGGAFFGVGEDVVGFAEFFEFFFGGGVAGVFVGVVFDGEFAVGFFDFFSRGGAGDAEDFVVVAFGGGHGWWF